MKMKNVPFLENRAIFGGRASGRLEMGVRGRSLPPVPTNIPSSESVGRLSGKLSKQTLNNWLGRPWAFFFFGNRFVK